MNRYGDRPRRNRYPKPLFIVENPNLLELQWLDELDRNENMEVAILDDAVGNEEEVPMIENKQVSIHAPASAAPSKHVTRIVEAEVKAAAPIERARSLPKGKQLHQYGLYHFTFKGTDHHTAIIPFDRSYADCEYAFVATTNLPFCYVVLQSKTENNAVVSIIRSQTAAGSSGCLNWITVGKESVASDR